MEAAVGNAHWCKSSLDGEIDARLPLDDRGLAYGDGLFETMRVVQGKIPLLDYHLDRLQFGCRALAIDYQPDHIKNCIASMLKHAQSEHCSLKLIYTRGSGGAGFIPANCRSPRLALTLKPLLEQSPLTGIRLYLCSQNLTSNRQLAGIKHLNRLEYVLAANKLPPESGPYGLLLDGNSMVVESLHHNLFVLNGRRLLTPALKDCGVKGVMRRYLLENVASFADIDSIAEVDDLSLADLKHADEMFLTNSLRGVIPVRAFDNKEWDRTPQTLALQKYVASIWDLK